MFACPEVHRDGDETDLDPEKQAETVVDLARRKYRGNRAGSGGAEREKDKWGFTSGGEIIWEGQD